MKKVLRLIIPPTKVREPIIFQMVNRYQLRPNILDAEVHKGSIGEVLLEIEGTPIDIEKGVLYLRELDIKIEEK